MVIKNLKIMYFIPVAQHLGSHQPDGE
jgi:hypothetical protein